MWLGSDSQCQILSGDVGVIFSKVQKYAFTLHSKCYFYRLSMLISLISCWSKMMENQMFSINIENPTNFFYDRRVSKIKIMVYLIKNSQ